MPYPHGRKVSDGIHVQVRTPYSSLYSPFDGPFSQMETFAVAEDSDAGSCPQKVPDIEDQSISQDFKRPPY